MSDLPVEELTCRDYRALAEFRSALRRFLRFSEEAARGEGLSPNQHQLLLAVRGWPDDGSPTIGGLAAALALRHHSTVELVGRAEEAGLVVLHRDPDDRRRQLVAVTASGNAKLARLSALHRDELRRFRAHLADVFVAIED